jgi:hypothetical protein
MRAYRTQQRANTDALRGIDGRGELVERLQRVTADRDRLQVEVNELRGRVRDLETATRQPPTSRPVRVDVVGSQSLSRAERRRLEREQRRRHEGT